MAEYRARLYYACKEATRDPTSASADGAATPAEDEEDDGCVVEGAAALGAGSSPLAAELRALGPERCSGLEEKLAARRDTLRLDQQPEVLGELWGVGSAAQAERQLLSYAASATLSPQARPSGPNTQPSRLISQRLYRPQYVSRTLATDHCCFRSRLAPQVRQHALMTASTTERLSAALCALREQERRLAAMCALQGAADGPPSSD